MKNAVEMLAEIGKMRRLLDRAETEINDGCEERLRHVRTDLVTTNNRLINLIPDAPGPRPRDWG